jgi:hypothetical protein
MSAKANWTCKERGIFWRPLMFSEAQLFAAGPANQIHWNSASRGFGRPLDYIRGNEPQTRECRNHRSGDSCPVPGVRDRTHRDQRRCSQNRRREDVPQESTIRLRHDRRSPLTSPQSVKSVYPLNFSVDGLKMNQWRRQRSRAKVLPKKALSRPTSNDTLVDGK